ncbi:hypothetical protein HII31_08089 [Pseudocercospora fuligena]|uniref:Uncharacterized protein n=1 Tax=Pseudocercospora fuligena TaxID=685502 RepID=A0A8H6VGT1_9PEZI|nr:hypothetical protein HII31_08089 [Pseudocercospora fuligena]
MLSKVILVIAALLHCLGSSAELKAFEADTPSAPKCPSFKESTSGALSAARITRKLFYAIQKARKKSTSTVEPQIVSQSIRQKLSALKEEVKA